jgi:hypothetical protein
MRWFWPIWLTIIAAAPIFVAFAVGRIAVPRPHEIKSPLPGRLQIRTPRVVTALTLMAVFLFSYIAMTLVWEDFAYYDNEVYTLSSLKGYNLGLEISKLSGRFTPLADQEFNLIGQFTHTITGYHVLPIIQILLFFYFLLILDDELTIIARAILALLALLTPSILTSFNGLIFPERNVLFFLACLLLSVKRFEQTGSIAWAMAAVVCAQIMIYYKETASLMLLGFALGRVILRCKHGQYAGWSYDTLWDRGSRLDFCFALLGILFLLYYFAEMGFHINVNYAETSRQPLIELIFGYLRIDLLAWSFMGVALGRVYLILRHRVPPLLLWDGLALGGAVCFVAYLYLGIFGIYYLAPVDLIAILYIGRFSLLSWGKMRSLGKIAITLLGVIILLQNLLVSSYAVFERKNVIHGKAEIASVVEARYRNGGGHSLRLFFPFASPYVIMEFAAYLDYRGLPVEAVNEPAGANSVVFVTRSITEDGPCVTWVSIKCHTAIWPTPGDLVIVLPDDNAPSAETSAYRAQGELLFLYEPRPLIPDWLHSLFDSLYIATTRLRHERNPDRWMDASVMTWK